MLGVPQGSPETRERRPEMGGAAPLGGSSLDAKHSLLEKGPCFFQK